MRISRLLVVTIMVLALAVPLGASAAQFAAGEQYTLRSSETVLENLYVAAGRASIAGQVLGDLILAGGQVSVTGDVLEDALVLGGNVNVFGVVGGDLRVAGGQIIIDSSVGNDLVIAGGQVAIYPDAIVDGDLYVAGGEVTLEGTVTGDVHMVGGQLTIIGSVLGDVTARVDESLTIVDGALVRGALTYKSRNRAEIAKSARVIGGVTFDQIAKVIKQDKGGLGKKAGSAFAGIAALMLSWRILTVLGFALFVTYAWKEWSVGLVKATFGSFLRSFGFGLVTLIVMPIIIVLLLISFVGTLLGGFGIPVFVGLIILANIMAVLLAAALLARYLSKTKTWRLRWPWIVLAVFVLQLLVFLPVLGWLAKTVLFLAALGALSRQLLEFLHVKV